MLANIFYIICIFTTTKMQDSRNVHENLDVQSLQCKLCSDIIRNIKLFALVSFGLVDRVSGHSVIFDILAAGDMEDHKISIVSSFWLL